MSNFKLLRQSLISLNLSWKVVRQPSINSCKSCRFVSSACVSNFCLNKDTQCLKATTFVPSKRPLSTEVNKTFEVINIQDEIDFQKRVLSASDSKPIVVDFHATWCAPCKMLAPRLESLISKKEGKVTLVKVDIDENPDIAMEYGVRSVPTVVGIKNGEKLNQFIGLIDDDQMDSFVEKLIIS